MKKGILSIILAFLVATTNTSVLASQIAVPSDAPKEEEPWNYDNIEAEINQIKNFISRGLYLEAIQVCEETLAWHELSYSDKSILAQLKWDAKEAYNEYLESMDTSTSDVNNPEDYKSKVYNAYYGKLKEYSLKPETFGLSYREYYVYDINKDGTPELIIRLGTTPNDLLYEYFSYVDDKVVKIGEYEHIRSSLMTYPEGNGIIVHGGAQGTRWIYLVSYVNGKLKEEIILEPTEMDVSLGKIIPNSITFTDNYSERKIGNTTVLDRYFKNNTVVLTNKENAANQYDDVTNEINQINSFISRGLYLEAIQVCEETLAWHELSEMDKASISALKTTATSNYNTYSERLKYYDATNEINQIKKFISWGMYLEAIQVCEETLAWHELSESDQFIINGLKSSAQNQYNAYIISSAYYDATAEINQIKNFISRGMYFEAMKVCDETLDWHRLSPVDVKTITELGEYALRKCEEYLAPYIEYEYNDYTLEDYLNDLNDSKDIIEQSIERYKRNVRMLTEGGLGGLRF